MRYIQKIGSPCEAAGIQCTQSFLDKRWQKNKYVSFGYHRNRLGNMDRLLVQEQTDPKTGHAYCCYCMRRLFLADQGVHNKNVTLEHIVPNHIDCQSQKADIKGYQQYPCLKDDHILICDGGVLPSNITTKITKLPYPHFVSYHNLVASCDGRTFQNVASAPVSGKCCNNRRGKDYVEPLFLDKDMAQWVQYYRDGTLDFDDELLDAGWFDNKLNLSSWWLCQVRHIWALVAGSSYTPDDVESAIQDTALRQDIIDDIDRKNEIADWTDNQAVWTLFAEYSWFYYYYQNQ